jgi:hypothetical protein
MQSQIPSSPNTRLARKRARELARESGDMSQVESRNITRRIEGAMHAIGVPTTPARMRYARLVGCVRAMRGSALRWHAAWALYNILKDWLRCPANQYATTYLLEMTALMENELLLCVNEE